MTNRIESLDWLRGLMAIAVMLYHLTYWHIEPLESSSFLGRFGIYGVSIFFILSGLSMAIVYSKYISDKRTVAVFYIRRIFRIWPLLWLCVAIVVALKWAQGEGVSAIKIILNLTTLFGFVAPGAYINGGAWSIGNEMVYYAFTPLIIYAFERNKNAGNLLLLASFALSLYFGFYLLDSNESMASQWQTYINPFNNIFLYIAGIAVFYNLKKAIIPLSALISLLLVSLSIFIFYPADGDKIAIVTGVNRIVFLLSSIIAVICFYKFSHHDFIPKYIIYPLEKFGLATYGVYLLHPLVDKFVGVIFARLNLTDPIFRIFSTVSLTIIVALIVYNLLEKRVMDYGKKITNQRSYFWNAPFWTRR